MDIAAKHSGTASGIMNTGSALAAIVSPVAGGILIDLTGSWELPFIVSMGFLALGMVLPSPCGRTSHSPIPGREAGSARLPLANNPSDDLPV